MLVSVFGTSTPYGFWGFNAVRHVMQVVYGDHHHIHCLTIEDLRQNWPERDGKPVVFTSDCPDTEISDLFIASGAPMIAFLDEPEDAIAFAKVSRNLSILELSRFTSYCFCSIHEILRDPNTFRFQSNRFTDDVREIFAELLTILTGSVDFEQLEKVMHRAIFDYHSGQFIKVSDVVALECANITMPAQAFAIQPPELQNFILAISDAYRPILEGKTLLQLNCPRELLYTSNEGNTNHVLIDMAGPSRLLIWGPYLHLPKGYWVAKVDFEVAENFSGAQLETDVHDGAVVLTLSRVILPIEGIYSFELRFTVKNLPQVIHVRLCLLNGAIEGKFCLRSLTLWQPQPLVEKELSLPHSNQGKRPIWIEA